MFHNMAIVDVVFVANVLMGCTKIWIWSFTEVWDFILKCVITEWILIEQENSAD